MASKQQFTSRLLKYGQRRQFLIRVDQRSSAANSFLRLFSIAFRKGRISQARARINGRKITSNTAKTLLAPFGNSNSGVSTSHSLQARINTNDLP